MEPSKPNPQKRQPPLEGLCSYLKWEVSTYLDSDSQRKTAAVSNGFFLAAARQGVLKKQRCISNITLLISRLNPKNDAMMIESLQEIVTELVALPEGKIFLLKDEKEVFAKVATMLFSFDRDTRGGLYQKLNSLEFAYLLLTDSEMIKQMYIGTDYECILSVLFESTDSEKKILLFDIIRYFEKPSPALVYLVYKVLSEENSLPPDNTIEESVIPFLLKYQRLDLLEKMFESSEGDSRLELGMALYGVKKDKIKYAELISSYGEELDRLYAIKYAIYSGDANAIPSLLPDYNGGGELGPGDGVDRIVGNAISFCYMSDQMDLAKGIMQSIFNTPDLKDNLKSLVETAVDALSRSDPRVVDFHELQFFVKCLPEGELRNDAQQELDSLLED